jgi:hypothetical protein
MKQTVDSWFDRLEEGIDAVLHRLQRHCPKCGGCLHRKFSLLDKIGLYIPLPHTIYAKHQCDACHTRFRSFRSLTDLFLEAAWFSALLFLGEYRFIALACPITWLVTSYLMKDSKDSSYDTIVAGMLTGILWLLALVFGNEPFRNFFFNHSIGAFFALLLMIFTPICVVLALDRYTSFQLREYN